MAGSTFDADADPRRLVVDTDTASDDALALLLAARSARAAIEAVTVVAGNVDFDRQVENAKYVLSLAGVDVPVHEGAREPLEKAHESAANVHGDGGLGGDLRPETGVESAEEEAVDRIVRAAREDPGEGTLLCLGPLTNVALALDREPDLGELFGEVWVMGGARNTLGNVTPAAEYNFWVDPDAARRVLDAVEVTLVDWGVCVSDGRVPDAAFEAVAAARDDAPFADFFVRSTRAAREFAREKQGVDGVVLPDALAAALLLDPSLVESSARYFVDVDEREGMTRGYSLVDELGVTGREPNARVVTSADADGFVELVRRTLLEGDPHA